MVSVRTIVRERDGRQVIELPETVHIEGEEVLISQDDASGAVTISTMGASNPWPRIFAEIDAIDVSEQDWEEFEDRLYNVRTVPLGRERAIFDDDDLD